MLNKIKSKLFGVSKEIKSATVYTFATLFSRGLAIITVPIFTRIMTSAEIGEVNLYNSWYSLLSVIATLSLTSGGFSVAMKEFERERDKYLSSVLSLTSVMSLVMAVIFSIAPDFWSNLMGLPMHLIYLMCIGFLCAPARDFWLARQRFEYKYKAAAIITIISAILATANSIAVVLYMNHNGIDCVVSGRLYANYIIIYGVSFLIWLYVFKKGKTFYNKKYWKLSLSLSIPLIGHSLASQVLSVSDRVMISDMVGNSAVGIYSTLYSVSSIAQLVWGALNASFIPYLYQNLEKPEKRASLVKVSNLLIAMYGGVVILCAFFAPEVVRILATEEYYEAIYIIPPIISGVFLIAVANMYSNILLYNKKTPFIMLSTSVAAVLNIILNYIFIPKFGYMAAAYTTLFSYVLMALMEMICANLFFKKEYPEKQFVYENKTIVLIACVSILISLCGLVLYRYTLLRYLAIVVVAIVVLILYRKKEK